MGRILGIALIAGGVIVGIIIAVLMSVYNREGNLSTGAATLGFVIGTVVLVLPQLGIGAFLLWKGGQEAAASAQANKQRQLLNIVKTQGQVAISDLVIQMKSSRDEVEQMLRELVGMGLFSGYVVWQEGMLYSREARELRQQDRCLNCNGQLELAGKGVIRCPYCGTEYFLD